MDSKVSRLGSRIIKLLKNLEIACGKPKLTTQGMPGGFHVISKPVEFDAVDLGMSLITTSPSSF